MVLHHNVGTMMTRTQISMDKEMLRRARQKAADQRISLAEYLRRLVSKDLGEIPPKGDVRAIFNLFSSDEPTNIRSDKDRMVGEAVRKLHGK